MTDLQTAAEDDGNDNREIVLSRNAVGAWQLNNSELTDSDEIRGEDSFPEHGSFLDVNPVSRGSDEYSVRENEDTWLECPNNLAKALVELDIEPEDAFRILSVRGGNGRAYQFEVEELNND